MAVVPKGLQGRDSSNRQGCRFLKREIRALPDQCFLQPAGVLRETSQTRGEKVPEDLIARLKTLDIASNGLNLPRDVGPEDGVLGFEKPEGEAHEEGVAPQEMPIQGVHGCRLD